MYSKHFIPFFCVALYFLQCQGALPNFEQLDAINEIIRDYLYPEGIVDEENRTTNLIGLRDIIEKVGRRIGGNKEIPTVDELKTIGSRFTYTLWEVKRYVAKFVDCEELTKEMEPKVRSLFESFNRPNGIYFQELDNLLTRLWTAYRNPDGKYPYHKEPKTAIPYKMARSEYKFTRDEVTTIVTDFFFPGFF
ncbi:uncharacterized protein LOC126838773 [Adelges cooleyi]|uniref:uncharacterized protein LOC126838773 n=1 Tax=Adelges cooleyi TaxID=133065 RepID=UPI00217FD5D1|nr:uncharacterized protein LOC126838773 [Adelges cooleyi]